MKLITPEIAWHGREPVYSVDCQPGNRNIRRIASGGQDKIVRVWQFSVDGEGKGQVEFLSNLRRHTATVNVVRFSKSGDLLATAGDDTAIILWKLSDVPAPVNSIFSGEDDVDDDKETWVCHKTLRGHLGDVSDLSWSKNDRYLVSGSVDNSAIVWDVKKDTKLAMFTEHKSYVQGVTFDPQGDLIATLSSDRSLRIYNIHTKSCIHNVSKMAPLSNSSSQKIDTPTLVCNENISESKNSDSKDSDSKTPDSKASDTKPKPFKMFQDDSLRSFFRRLEFSPDGQLLFTPAGCVEAPGDGRVTNVSFVFTRGALTKPSLYLPCGDKATTVVRLNPQLFTLRQSPPPSAENEAKGSDAENSKESSEDQKEWEKNSTLFCLPYRMVYAAASEDTVLIYDTQQTLPVGLLKNIHYHQISDLSWSSDGQVLIVSSTDGFCTIVTFEKGELGDIYIKPQRVSERQANRQDDSKKEDSKSDTESSLPFSQYIKDNDDNKDTPDGPKDMKLLQQEKSINSGSSTPKEKSEPLNSPKEEKVQGEVVKQMEIGGESPAIKDDLKQGETKDEKTTSNVEIPQKKRIAFTTIESAKADEKNDTNKTEIPQKKRISFTTISLNKK